MRLAMPFIAVHSAFLSVLRGKIVNIWLQDWLCEPARLTLSACKIVLMTMQDWLYWKCFAWFLTTKRQDCNSENHVAYWESRTYITQKKITRKRRKTDVRKTRWVLRRFYHVKMVSYAPFSGSGWYYFNMRRGMLIKAGHWVRRKTCRAERSNRSIYRMKQRKHFLVTTHIRWRATKGLCKRKFS